jgi:hypothetical protein
LNVLNPVVRSRPQIFAPTGDLVTSERLSSCGRFFFRRHAEQRIEATSFFSACLALSLEDRRTSAMLQEATMALAGWLLIVARLLFMVVQAIWPGTFMGTSRSFDGEGFRFSTNWPGFELIAFGAILLVIGAAQG